MSNPLRIVLIGPRYSGKSSISKILSFYTQKNSISTDLLTLYESEYSSIQNYVHKHGWKSFRTLEKKVLEKLNDIPNVILDTGGGIITDLDENNNEILCPFKTELLKKESYLIYLPPSTLSFKENITKDLNRPILSNTQYQKVIEQRTPWYCSIANYTAPPISLDVSQTATKIFQHLITNKIL